jgi:hypothetical protein
MAAEYLKGLGKGFLDEHNLAMEAAAVPNVMC